MYDVIIIGAGVSGAASARELSRYKVNACVLEREEDVCCGTSKANSAIVHAGYDAAEGSLMARLNVEGNQIMPELAKELDFPFNPCGSFVVCLDEESLPDLRALYERGVKNGVKDLEIITDKARIKEMEPNLADEAAGVLYAPTAGIVCPFNLNIALAENAYTNGVDFKFNTEVTDIRRIEGGWALETNQGVYETRCVVNAAGVHADKFHNMVSGTKIHITPRRGDYCLLDKSAGNHVSHTIFALPGKYGKGVLVSPTVHGNLIVGPTAIDIEDKEATATTREGLDELIAKAKGTKTPEELAAEVYAACGDPFWILLAHRNNRFARQYSLLGADLVCSGHAHGGIVRLPGTDGLFSHDLDLFPSYTAGLYEENGSVLFVTRGLGNSGPSFRVFNRPEIAVLTLRRAEG